MFQDSGLFKVSFKSVSRVLKGNFMGVFVEVIAATRAYGGFVFIFNHRNRRGSQKEKLRKYGHMSKL